MHGINGLCELFLNANNIWPVFLPFEDTWTSTNRNSVLWVTILIPSGFMKFLTESALLDLTITHSATCLTGRTGPTASLTEKLEQHILGTWEAGTHNMNFSTRFQIDTSQTHLKMLRRKLMSCSWEAFPLCAFYVHITLGLGICLIWLPLVWAMLKFDTTVNFWQQKNVDVRKRYFEFGCINTQYMWSLLQKQKICFKSTVNNHMHL